MKILISTSSFGKVGRRPLDFLAAAGMEVVLNPHGRKLQPVEAGMLLADVAGVVAGTEKLSRDVLAGAPQLQVISRCGTGLDSVDMAAAADLGIAVYNTPDAHVAGVAELTLGGILAMLRHVGVSDRQLRDGVWKKRMGQLLGGKRVGLIGCGRVAKHLVALLQPFQVELVAYDPAQDVDFAAQYGVAYVTLDEVLAAADIVSLHLPYSQKTHGQYGAGWAGR